MSSLYTRFLFSLLCFVFIHKVVDSMEPNANDDVRSPEKQLPKRILFYNPANFHLVRNIKETTSFDGCEEKNCEITFNKSEASHSDAVIIHSRNRGEFRGFERPAGQIWIMVQHEAPVTYRKEDAHMFQVPLLSQSFNAPIFYFDISVLAHTVSLLV